MAKNKRAGLIRFAQIKLMLTQLEPCQKIYLVRGWMLPGIAGAVENAPNNLICLASLLGVWYVLVKMFVLRSPLSVGFYISCTPHGPFLRNKQTTFLLQENCRRVCLPTFTSYTIHQCQLNISHNLESKFQKIAQAADIYFCK